MDDAPSPRRRGLRLVVLAVLLLGAGLVLMALLRPEQGAYPGWTQAVVHVVWVVACLCFGVGGFHTLVGAPGTGALALLRTPVAIVFGLATTAALAVGGFVLHAAMSYDGPRSSAGDSHDWDWD